MHTFKLHIQEAFKSKRFKQNISSDMVKKIIEGNVDISDQNLKSILDVQDYSSYGVVGDFDCSCNLLNNLEGAPRTVEGAFYCIGSKLESLEGAPQVVGGGFMCSFNLLTSLEGAPKEVGGHFICKSNIHKFTEREVRAVCNVHGRVVTG